MVIRACHIWFFKFWAVFFKVFVIKRLQSQRKIWFDIIIIYYTMIYLKYS